MNEIKQYFLRFKKLKGQAGFTLLIAALIASIVLSIASAIFSITQKQIALASLSQQSQYAFYAADTAAECALYWDERFNYFGTTTPSAAALPYSPVCAGQSISLAQPLNNQPYDYADPCYYAPGKVSLPCYTIPSAHTTQLQPINLFTSGTHSYCAQITVTKFLDNTTNPSTVHTLINADGYNVDCADTATNQSALERSVQLNY